jgi:hypothetical protein
MPALTHIAGMKVQIGPLLRQRCAWCGAVLCDYDLRNIAVPEGQEGAPAMWEPGELVRVDGTGLMSASFAVPHTDGDELPDDACGKLDPEVTV